MAISSQAQRLVPASVSFRLVDDSDVPVENAAVTGSFLDDSLSGSSSRFNGMTDSNGMFVAKGFAMLGVHARFTREGYYNTTHEQWIEGIRRKDVQVLKQSNRWDPGVQVVLRPMKQQISMFINEVETIKLKRTSTNRLDRYILSHVAILDLFKDDAMHPHGSGLESDLEFHWKMDIYSMDTDRLAKDYDTRCEICLPKGMNGIRKGTPYGSENGQTGSAFISDYEAPEAGYTNSISFYRNVRGSKVETNDDKHYLYYFRIRTQTNELGQVTNAFYGKIYGQLNGNFTYYLNPTPNDRNVEHDPKKNLFKGQ